MTRIALILSIVGSLMLIVSGNVVLLILGRVVQGLSAAIIMPATISIVNDFFEGDERQKALSFWSIGAFGAQVYHLSLQEQWQHLFRGNLSLFCRLYYLLLR